MESIHATFPGAKRRDVVAGFDLPADAPKGTPRKCVRTSADIEAVAASQEFKSFKDFIGRLCRAVQLLPRSAVLGNTGVPVHRTVGVLRDMLAGIRSDATSTPLQPHSRFGNAAYRTFHERLASRAEELLTPLVAHRVVNDCPPEELLQELKGYLMDSFGNATRIDYGTGHELHFALLLYILEQVGCFAPLPAEGGAEQPSILASTVTLQQLVHVVFWGYIDTMRDIQAHFTMEPAGTHGVWGLDDYHHIPFIIGAAQLVTEDADEVSQAPTPYAAADAAAVPLPTTINDAATVARMKEDYLYFAMIDWIRNKKKGPFHEHSSVLYNVSGLEQWSRIMTGMVKMFEGEVIKKISVVQHLLFGAHFAFPGPAPRNGG